MNIHQEMTQEDAKIIRCYFRRLAGVGIAAAALIVFITIWATNAYAAKIAQKDKDWVRLLDSPCNREKVLVMYPAEYHKMFRNADAYINGNPYRACWVDDGDAYFLRYEDGDKGRIDKGDFRPEGV